MRPEARRQGSSFALVHTEVCLGDRHLQKQLEREGYGMDLRSVRARHPVPARGDIMFMGSPVRMGSVTGRVKRYVKKLSEDAWRDKPIVVLMTTLMPPENATDEQKRTQDGWDRTATYGLKSRA